MDGALTIPALSGVDAATEAIGGLVCLIIAVAALLRAPADARARVFLAFAVTNAVALGVTPIAWAAGVTDVRTLPRWTIAAGLIGLALSALFLFLLTQVFPRARPWIGESRNRLLLLLAFIVTPLAIAGLVHGFPAELADLSEIYLLVLILVGFPLLALLGVALPFGAILSLVRSYREAQAAQRTGEARTLRWMLIGQIAGGALAAVFGPVLAALTSSVVLQDSMKVVISAFGLLTPIAYAVGVWRDDGRQ